MTKIEKLISSLIVATPLFVTQSFAQTPTETEEPPARVLLNTTLDTETGAMVLDEVTVYEGTRVRQLTYQDLQKPELVGYQNSGLSPALYAHPMPPGTEIVEVEGDIGSPVSDSVRQTAKNYLSDNIVNSVFFDIGSNDNGITMRFDPPLVNQPGVDLLVGEMGAPAGNVSSGCPNTPSPGGDRLLLQTGDFTFTIEPENYTPQGPLGVMRYYGKEELRENVQISSVANLENYSALERNVIDHLHLFTSTVDLSDLGIPEGESISQITVGAVPIETTVDGEVVLCFTADPAFVYGLSAEQ